MVHKRVPSFSHRPNFPSGLQILLVDSEPSSRKAVESQLKAHSYVATCCTSCEEAAQLLTASKYDIVLAEAKLLAAEGAEPSSFFEAARPLPLVLMCEDSTADDVLKGIKLGACDFLEKPLSSLKLKNIWQHVVRKMMEGMHMQQAAESEACLTKGDREHSCNVKGKSVNSVPSCPKTPSPAASGADVGSIATTASKACDVVGESSTSETPKENSGDNDLVTECSNMKTSAVKGAVARVQPTLTAVPAASVSVISRTPDGTVNSAPSLPPLAALAPVSLPTAVHDTTLSAAVGPLASLAATIPATASAANGAAPAAAVPPPATVSPPAYHHGLPPFAHPPAPAVYLPPPAPASWTHPQAGNSCVMGTPMAPHAPPSLPLAPVYPGHHSHYVSPLPCMPQGFMPTPMGPGCGAHVASSCYIPPPQPTCAYQAVNISTSATATYSGAFELDLSGATAEDPAPIGLQLKKSASLLNLLSERVSQRAC